MGRRILAALFLATAAVLVAWLWRSKEPEPGTAGPPSAATEPEADAAGEVPREAPPEPKREVEPGAATVVGDAQSGWTVEGRCVTMPGGAAIPGCSIKAWLVREPRVPGWKAEERPATTGPDGRFRLAFAGNESTSSVLCSFDGRAPVSVYFERAPGGAVVDLGDVPLRLGTRLRVRVVDEQRRPVASATVQVGPHLGSRTPAGIGFAYLAGEGHVRTDQDGQVDLPYLKCAGRWQVFVIADGFEFGGPHVLEIPEGRATFEAELVVRAAPAADTVAGRVIDLAEQPVAGVPLVARPPSGSPIVSTRSQADGSFRFPDLRRHDLVSQIRVGLAREERGHELVAEPPAVALGTADLELRVRALRDFDLELRVTRGDSGAPVECYGHRVFDDPWTYMLPGHHTNYVPAAPVQHPDGRARVSGVRKGRYRVSVWPAGTDLAPLTFVRFEVPDGGPTPLHIVLHPWASLRVRLRTKAGTPVAGSRLQLVHMMGKSADGFTVTTHAMSLERLQLGDWGTTMQVILEEGTSDEQGEVVLRGPAQQPMLALRALGPGHVPCLHTGVVLNPGSNEVELAVVADAEIRGRIEPPEFLAFCRQQWSKPEETPRVLLRSDKERQTWAVTQSWPVAADGTFAVHGIPAGEWSLLVQFYLNRVSSAQEPVQQQLRLGEGEKRELVLDCSKLMPGRLSALVHVDGKPLASGLVGFLQFQRTDRARQWQAATADGEGRFTAWLVPGTYLPNAHVADAAGDHHAVYGSQWLEIRQGVTLEAVIELGRTGLELQLADEAGEPFANQTVWLRSRELGTTLQVKTDARGRAVVKSLPPGTLDLSFRQPADNGLLADVFGTIPPARGDGVVKVEMRAPRAGARR